MSISQLAHDIKESPTLVMNEKARQLQERGEAVIHLGSGEPKSKVPFDALMSCASKLKTANIRYTATEGTPSLLKAIVRYTENNYDKVVGPENIIVTAGAKQAIYNLMMTLVNPQDEVIILAPYWVSYPEIVKMVHGIPVIVTPEDGRFIPRIEDIAKAVSSSTKVMIVNSPNNPSGAVYSADLIAEIVALCEKKGIYLIMDDIYHKLVFNGTIAPSVYQFEKNNSDSSRIIVVNGVSKAYAMTGFRIGWTVCNRNVRNVLVKVQAQNTSCPSVLLQAASEGALNGAQSSVESLRLTLENNSKVMISELNSFNDVKLIEPKGTFYCLPDFSTYNKSSVELSKFLLEKALVVTVPGKEFGMEGHLRLSYCGSIKDITEGIARIKWALDPESPNDIYIGNRKLRRDWK